MLFLCPDTPTGKWSERHLATQRLLNAHGVHETVVDQPGSINASNDSDESSGTATPKDIKEKTSTPGDVESGSIIPTAGKEVPLSQQEMLEVAKGEIVVAPTFKEALHIVLSLQTLFHSMTYVCSFGGELAINSYIASYYLKVSHIHTSAFGIKTYKWSELSIARSDRSRTLGFHVWLAQCDHKTGTTTTCLC